MELTEDFGCDNVEFYIERPRTLYIRTILGSNKLAVHQWPKSSFCCLEVSECLIYVVYEDVCV